MNAVQVASVEKRFQKYEASIKKKALFLLNHLGLDGVSLDIYLAGDKITKELNLRFRNKNHPANVLSFREPVDFPRPDLKNLKHIGEIYLNPGMIKDGHAGGSSRFFPLFSASELLLHGILHLAGYDHRTKRDTIRMEKMERRILKKHESKSD